MEPEGPLASSPQIFMKYGRQRWKLKGRIEVNGKQSWDGEEMVFLPLIVGLISIKVQYRQVFSPDATAGWSIMEGLCP